MKQGVRVIKTMKKHIQLASAVVALVALSATAGGLLPAPGDAGAAVPQARGFFSPQQTERNFNRLIIKFKTPASTRAGVFDFRAAEDKVSTLSTNAQARNADAVGLSHLKSVSAQTQVALTDKSMTRGELFALAKQLEQDPSVEYAEIDELNYPQWVTFTPTDPDYVVQQWHYKVPGVAAGGANLPDAWGRATGAGVVVAVIDTGYLGHDDLAGQILPGYDFITDPIMANDLDGRDADAHDPGDWTAANFCSSGAAATNSSWHGTHVAGTIAALSNNAVGGVGVAFNAKILPVRVLGRCGGYSSDIAAGMLWAAGIAVPGVPANPNPAKVLNLSLGGAAACGATYQSTVNLVRAAGSVVVVATGNNGNANVISTPANCSGVIAVTAHTQSGDNAVYSNIGTGTTISAPGGGAGKVHAGDTGLVYSTLNAGLTVPDAATNRYGLYQGTSMATPHVAGVVALLASLQPAITPDAVAAILTNSARAHPPGTYCAGLATPTACGAGLLDGAAAVARLLDLPDPSVYASAGGGVKVTNSTVTLTGQAIPGNTGKAIASYQWTKLSGPAVVLNNSTTSSASFVASGTGSSYSFSVMVTDIDGKVATGQAYVQSDTAPVLAPIAGRSVAVGQSVGFTASATDAESNPITYVGTGLPAGSTLNSTTGVFAWNAAGPAGNYSFTITPTDGIFSGTPQTVAIAVTAPAAAPAAPAGGGGGGALNGWDILGLLALLAFSWGATRRRGAPK